MMDIFPLGGMLTLLVLLPNLLMVIFPPLSSPVRAPSPSGKRVRIAEILERVGQAGCFVLPFFYRLRLASLKDGLAACVMAVCLGLYYAGWVRYLVKGRDEALIYRSILGLPLPMAVLPVTYFFAAGVLLESIWLALAAVVLGVGHISVTALNARKFLPAAEK